MMVRLAVETAGRGRHHVLLRVGVHKLYIDALCDGGRRCDTGHPFPTRKAAQQCAAELAEALSHIKPPRCCP